MRADLHDSTLRSNISSGCRSTCSLRGRRVARDEFVEIDQHNQYMQMIRNTWVHG